MNCKKCGNQIEFGSRVCSFCGAPVENDQIAASQPVNQNSQVGISPYETSQSNQVGINPYEASQSNQVGINPYEASQSNQVGANGYSVNQDNQIAASSNATSQNNTQGKSKSGKVIIAIVVLAIIIGLAFILMPVLTTSKTSKPMVSTAKQKSAAYVVKDFNNQILNNCSKKDKLSKYQYYSDDTKTNKVTFEECVSSSCYVELSDNDAKDFAGNIGVTANEPAYFSATINKCVVEKACMNYTDGLLTGIKVVMQDKENFSVETGTCK